MSNRILATVKASALCILTAALLTVMSAQAKADVLAFWNFNDGTTDTVSGETLTSVDATIANGKLTATNGYLKATGSNGGVTKFTLPTGTSDYTLSAFLTTSNLAKVGIISWGTNSNTKCNAFRTTDSNKGLDSYWWGNDLAVDGYPVVSGGVENHVVSIGVNKTHYLYLNGQLIGSSTTNARAESNQNFCVGKTILDNERLNGTLDNVSIYNNAMSHMDIINIASSRYNGMTNWWKSSDTYDRVSGVNISAGASGTTVLTGDTGTMVFNRALSDNETAYYTGQLSADHTYIENNMAGSLATSTTWLNNGGTYALTDASTAPLGIYVGGNTSSTTLSANLADLDSVNKIVVLGGGVLGLTDDEINFTPSATTHVTIDGGTLRNSGSGTMTVNLAGTERIGKIQSDSNVTLNVANDAQFTGSFAGAGTFTKTGAGTLVQSASNLFTGTTKVEQGTYQITGTGTINGTVNVENGAKLLFDNAVPHNTSDLTINLAQGGTVEFDMTTAERSAVTAIASAGKTVKFTGDGTWIKSGTGELHCASANNQPVTFALSSNAKMIVEEGTFYNGGWQKQNWSENYAELVIKADGAVNFWDGVKMQVGGLTGEEGAQIVATASNSKGITIGAGTTSDQTFTYNGTMLCNIASTITKTGASTQVLNGDMTRVAVQANEGTIVLGTAGNEIVVDTDSSIKTGGGAVRVDGNLTIKSGLLTVQGDWTGTGDIKVNTGGQLRITTNFSYPNDITLNGGILRNATDGRTVSVDAPINVISDSYIQSGWSDYVTLKGALKGSGNITVPSDSGYVVFTGDASQFKGALSLYCNIRVGKSETDATDCVNYIGSKKISLYEGGLIQNNNNNITITNDLDVLGESGFKTGWSKNITLTGNVTGSAKLKQVSDSGWLILKTHSDNDAFTGPFQTGWASTSSRGQTQLAAEQPLGANAGVFYNYGYLDMNGFSQKFKGVMDDGANNKKGRIYNTTDAKSTLTLDITSQDLTYAGTIEGNIEVIINSDGEGTQTFSNGGSSYTGNLVINGGKVVVTGGWNNGNKTSALGKLQSGRTVTVNKGAELVLAKQDVIANASTNSLVQIIVDGGKLSNSGEVYNNLANTIFKNGAQMYASNGNATWLGYKLSNKVSVLRTDAAADPVEFSSDLTKEKTTYSFGHGTSLYIEDVTSESATALDTKSDLIISAIITNPHNESNRTFYKDGKGTLEFTAANTFNGTASIREGVLRLSGEGSLGTATAAVSEGATLEFAVENEKWFNNKVTGSGTLLKTGDGTLYLNGTDANPINANALNVDGGSLMFKGVYTGNLTVKNGALFSPGNSVGKLTENGNFILELGAKFLLEVGKDEDDNVIADELVVNGNAYFNAGSILWIDMDGESSLVGNDVFSTTITANNAAEIFDYVSAALQSYYFTDLSVSLLDPTNPTVLLISGRLDPNAVPEPSTWALLILGIMGLMFVRKRK